MQEITIDDLITVASSLKVEDAKAFFEEFNNELDVIQKAHIVNQMVDSKFSIEFIKSIKREDIDELYKKYSFNHTKDYGFIYFLRQINSIFDHLDTDDVIDAYNHIKENVLDEFAVLLKEDRNNINEYHTEIQNFYHYVIKNLADSDKKVFIRNSNFYFSYDFEDEIKLTYDDDAIKMWYLDNNQIDQKFRTRLIASMKKDEHKLPYLKCLEEKITSLSPEYVKIAKEVAKDMSKILSSTDESSNNEEINKKIEKMKVNFVSNNLIHDNDFISASSFTNVLSSIKDDTLKKELLDKYNYKLNPEENKVSLNDIDEFWVKILTSFHSQETISELIKSYNDRFSHNAKIKVIAQKMDDQEKYRTFNEELTAKPTPSNSFYSKKWNYVKKKNNLKLLVQSLSDYDLELVALDQYLNVFGHLNTKDELELYSNASNYKTRLNYFNDIKSRYKNTKKLSKSIDKD